MGLWLAAPSRGRLAAQQVSDGSPQISSRKLLAQVQHWTVSRTPAGGKRKGWTEQKVVVPGSFPTDGGGRRHRGLGMAARREAETGVS